MKYEFRKIASEGTIYKVREYADNGKRCLGGMLFSFDGKTVLDYWTDYEKLTKEQKWLFDDTFQFWAMFKATDEEKRKLRKEHPNWK